MEKKVAILAIESSCDDTSAAVIIDGVLRSNVIASSLGDINANGGDVSVNAVSQSGEVTPEEGSDEEARMTGAIKALGDKLNPTRRSIRAIGIAAGVGGQAGVGIAAGAVRTDRAALERTGRRAGERAGGAPAERRKRRRAEMRCRK